MRHVTRDGTELSLEALHLQRDGLDLTGYRHPGPGIPTFFLCGGPGETALPYLNLPRLRDIPNLVLIEQRQAGILPLPDPTPASFATKEAYQARYLDALRDITVDPNLFTSLESARDLLAWAELLEAPKIKILAHSYGTHLAQHFLRLAPDRVERAVFLGFEGPDQTFKLPHRTDAMLRRLELRENLVRAMDRAPFRLTWRGESYEIPAEILRHLVGSTFGLRPWQPKLTNLLEALAEGNTEPLPEVLDLLVKGSNRPLTYFLKDAASGGTTARLAQIAEEPGFNPNFLLPEHLGEIPHADLGDEHRRPLESDVPILVVTGELDGFTPSSNFLESATWLPNSTHRELPGAFHDDLLRAHDAYEEFLLV
jgi:pimeloyl-ACP methyl ester carboxylesterase